MRAPQERPEPDEEGFVPTKWWMIIAPDGSIWSETSSPSEIEQQKRPGDRVQRLYMKTVYEWRDEEPEPELAEQEGSSNE